MNNTIECPECGHMMDVESEDLPRGDDGICSHQCPECEKEFMLHIEISYYLSAYKAPCLNGSKHQYCGKPFEMDGDFTVDGKKYKHYSVNTCIICGHNEKEFS